MTGTGDPRANPGLLDVVPWRYGFAHTWALRWLLTQGDLAPLVLGSVPKWQLGHGPRVVEGPETEKRFGGFRADLAFAVETRDGHRYDVALETKVEDTYRAEQVAGYQREGRVALMYLPGLTGFLIAGNQREHGELHLTGDALATALDDEDLPHLIGSYLRTVRSESERFDQTLLAVRQTGRAPPTIGETQQGVLTDVAWLVAVHQVLRELAPKHGIAPDARLRAEANDRGIFWYGARRTMPQVANGKDVGLYIDIIAPVRSADWTVAVKAGWGTGQLSTLYHYARDAGPPSADRRWRAGAARLGGNSVTVWRAAVADMPPSDAAGLALEAATWIQEVAAAV